MLDEKRRPSRLIRAPAVTSAASFGGSNPAQTLPATSDGSSSIFSESTSAAALLSTSPIGTPSLSNTLASISSSRITASSSHSVGPSPSAKPLKSSRQAKPKVGAIVGGSLAVLALIFLFFLWRYLVLRATRRKRLASPASGRDVANLGRDIELSLPTSSQDVIYPPEKNSTAHNTPEEPITPPTTQSKAALRQQYLADELRAVQEQQDAVRRIQEERTPEPVPSPSTVVTPSESNVPSDTTSSSAAAENSQPTTTEDLEHARRQNEVLRRRIQELEAQQRSDWARGLTDQPPPGYSE